MTLVEWMFVCN